MTPSNTKEYLLRYRTAGTEIERLKEEIAWWQSRAESATGILRLAHARGSRSVSHVEEAVIAIDGLLAELGVKQTEQVRLRMQIERAIGALEDERLRTLLRHRYISGLPLEAIAERMGYTSRNITRLHNKALAAVAENHVLECPVRSVV